MDGPEPGDGGADMRAWVRDNMLADRPSTVKEERERASRFISVASDGTVVVKPQPNFAARHQALAYFVGKHYAVAGGLSDSLVVSNQELAECLNMPTGTVGRCVMELRDARIVKAVDSGKHELPLLNLSKALDELETPSPNGN